MSAVRGRGSVQYGNFADKGDSSNGAKTFGFFKKFGVSAQTRGVKAVQTFCGEGGGGQFFAISCRHLLWTAPCRFLETLHWTWLRKELKLRPRSPPLKLSDDHLTSLKVTLNRVKNLNLQTYLLQLIKKITDFVLLCSYVPWPGDIKGAFSVFQ